MSVDNPTPREYAALAFALALARGELFAIAQGDQDNERLRLLVEATSLRNIASALGLKETQLSVDWVEYLSHEELSTLELKQRGPSSERDMAQSNRLKVGQVYFGLSYEDDDLTRPIVDSYEYLGVDLDGTTTGGTSYFFRYIGSDDRLQLKEHQIPHLILDVPGLTEELKRWAEAQATRTR